MASAGGRGIALIVVAVLIGAFLLNQTEDTTTISAVSPPSPPAAAGDTTTGSTTTDGSVTDGSTGDSVTDGSVTGDSSQETQASTSGTVAAEARPFNQVRVLVLNGKSGIGGVAREMTDTIGLQGYTMLEAGDGPEHQQTTVYAAATFEGDCQRLAQFVATTRSESVFTAPMNETITAEAPTAVNADCVVVIGKPQTTTSVAGA
jgi:LytR cell envelope-related transcriptional attenuator